MNSGKIGQKLNMDGDLLANLIPTCQGDSPLTKYKVIMCPGYPDCDL